MRINNNFSSPNFGKLVISREALSKLSEEQCNELYKAGAELKDTKYVDLLIDEDGLPVVVDEKYGGVSYYAICIDKPSDQYLTVYDQYGAPLHKRKHGPAPARYAFANAQAAVEAYERITKAKDRPSLDKYIELAKTLDEAQQFSETEMAKYAEAKKRLEQMRQDLYDRYGL